MKRHMKHPLNTIIITSLLTLLLASAAQVFAHGGFDHVTGTVVKLDNNVLTVKTAKGIVLVTLDAKTESLAAINPRRRRIQGGRPRGGRYSRRQQDRIAIPFKIGTAAKAGTVTSAHDSHK